MLVNLGQESAVLRRSSSLSLVGSFLLSAKSTSLHGAGPRLDTVFRVLALELLTLPSGHPREVLHVVRVLALVHL